MTQAKQLKRRPKPIRPVKPCEHAWRYQHTDADAAEVRVTSQCHKCGLQAFETRTREIEE